MIENILNLEFRINKIILLNNIIKYSLMPINYDKL